MRQTSLSVREISAIFLSGLYFIYIKSSPNTPQVITCARRKQLKDNNILGEYAKSILQNMEYTNQPKTEAILANLRPK